MSAPAKPNPAHHPVVAKINSKLEARPLPILRRTVGRVVALASKPHTDVGELTQTILQDQSFTARVIAVANGAFYRNRAEPITTVTRAIVQVGYNTIRDIAVAAEFLDMAQERLPKGVNIHGLLAKALLAAHQARALAEAGNLREAEGVFTTSQLQSIGELALALYMPNEYRRVEELVYAHGVGLSAAHQEVLEISTEELTEGVMEVCKLPQELIVREPDWSSTSSWRADTKKEAVIVLANQVAEALLAPQTPETIAYIDRLVVRAAQVLSLSTGRVVEILTEAFSKACSLGKSLGLQACYFSPQAPDPESKGDQELHPLVRGCLAFVEASGVKQSAFTPRVSDSDSIGSASMLVNLLKDLTDQVMNSTDFNSVVSCVLETLHRAVGFDHSIVLFAVPGKPLAVGRYGVGPDAPNLLSHFVVATDSEEDVMAQCIQTRTPMRFAPSEETVNRLPPGLLESLGPTAVALGPLYLPTRPVGLIWADRTAGEIDDAMWDSFQLVVMQANLALMRLSAKS